MLQSYYVGEYILCNMPRLHNVYSEKINRLGHGAYKKERER